MKKVLFAALIVLPVLFSCGKNNGDENGEKEVTLTTPKEASSAVALSLATPVSATIKNKTVTVQHIEFFRSGNYLLTAYPMAKADGDGEILHFSGTFTYENGQYKCTGDYTGNIGVSGSNVSMEGQQSNATSSKPTITTGSFEDFLYRSWTLSNLQFNISKPATIKQRVDFPSATVNVTEACRVANGSGATIDLEKVNGYDVSYVDVSPGAFMVKFVNNKTYAGTWKLSSQNFSFKLDEELTSGFINGEANGSITKSDDNKLKATLTVNTDKLVGTVILTLAPKN